MSQLASLRFLGIRRIPLSIGLSSKYANSQCVNLLTNGKLHSSFYINRFSSIENIGKTSSKQRFHEEIRNYIIQESESITNKNFEEIINIGKKNRLSDEACNIAIMKACVDDYNYSVGSSFIDYMKTNDKIPENAVLVLYLKILSVNLEVIKNFT